MVSNLSANNPIRALFQDSASLHHSSQFASVICHYFYLECKSIIYADPKGVLIKEQELTVPVNPDTYCTKTKKRLQAMKKGNKKLQECNSFFESRPYHSNTAFGHIALIDTEKTLHKTMSEMCLTKEMKSESEQVESAAFKMLIDGKFFAHTGTFALFNIHQLIDPNTWSQRQNCCFYVQMLKIKLSLLGFGSPVTLRS